MGSAGIFAGCPDGVLAVGAAGETPGRTAAGTGGATIAAVRLALICLCLPAASVAEAASLRSLDSRGGCPHMSVFGFRILLGSQGAEWKGSFSGASVASSGLGMSRFTTMGSWPLRTITASTGSSLRAFNS